MEQGVIGRYDADQLVVAIPDRAIVQQALEDLGVRSSEEDRDNRLGLALLDLSNVAGDPRLADDTGLVTRTRAAMPQQAEPSDLDLLIRRLREDFGNDYGGWLPVVGKNRMIAPVRGLPYVGGGGEGNPVSRAHAAPVASEGPSGRVGSSEPGRHTGPQPWLDPRPSRPGRGVRVGLLDTQLYRNPWLAGGYVAAAGDLLPDTANGQALLASQGHATFVAGLILNRAPAALLDIRHVLDARELGKAWDVAKIMADFAGSGADILNLSFGCYTDDGQPPLVLARAVSVVSPEILLVAAAGNHGNIDELRRDGSPLAAEWTKDITPRTPVWPAAFDQVIGVGATDRGLRAPFSPDLPWVDVMAPGVGVESTYLTGKVQLAPQTGNQETDLTGKVQLAPQTGNQERDFTSGFATWDGTSFAAASVSGAVAAKIQPGRRNARQALREILEAPKGDIRRFRKP